MKKIAKLLILFYLVFVNFALADFDLPSSFNRLQGVPLDNSSVFETYEEARAYAAAGAQTNSTAHKGQVISIPSQGMFYITDDWELQSIGGEFTAHAGRTQGPDEFETLITKDLFFDINFNTNIDYTYFTLTTNYNGEVYHTLMFPSHGLRGADGSNLKFEGFWNGNNQAYESKDILVSYFGRELYVTIVDYVPAETPIDDTNYWRKVVSRGERGDAGTITIDQVITGLPQTDAVITNKGTAEEAILDITIPRGNTGERGIPGLGLTYSGYWETNTVYPTNTVVRYGTNLWYTEFQNSSMPSSNNPTWNVFLNDGERGPEGLQGTIGLTGPMGPPGTTYSIYSGVWDSTAGREYMSNMWFTYSGDVYAVLENFTPATNSAPTNYINDKVILLCRSGKDGLPGGSLVVKGNWNSNNIYEKYDLVRFEGTQYWCGNPTSQGQVPTNSPSGVWNIFVKDGITPEVPANIFVETNLVWSGLFTNNVYYRSNSIVYYPEDPYGVYYVIKDFGLDNPGYRVPQSLTNTEYFLQLVRYGKEGKNGTDGKQGEIGPQGRPGADGTGDLLFGGLWDPNRSYPSNYIVSVVDEYNPYSLYVSLTNISEEINSTITPGNPFDPWGLYWELLLKSGTNGVDGIPGTPGGNYQFEIGWESTKPYYKYDICIVSNEFYLCNAIGGVSGPPAPWDDTYGNWIKLISPNYREYPLIETKEYVETKSYQMNELVRYNGSTYVALKYVDQSATPILPTQDPNSWGVIAERGDIGPMVMQAVKSTETLDDETAMASVTNELVGNINTGFTNMLSFKLPRGKTGRPGVGLTYLGDYDSNYGTYPSNSVVRNNSRLWFCESETPSSFAPGISTNWSIFLNDGMPSYIYVSDNTATLTPDQKAYVTYVQTNANDIILTFGIPQGKTGDVITPVVKGTVQLSPEYPAYVSNNIVGTESQFYFGIPEGKPGVGLRYYGDWTAEHSGYPSNTVVRSGTNLWVSLVSTTSAEEPGSSDKWAVYLRDGSPALISVDTEVTKLDPTNNPSVNVVTTNGNNVHLKFSIPQGYTGDTIIPFAYKTDQLEPNVKAYVSNNIVGTTNNLTFGIPKGDKGDPGSGLSYVGDYSSSYGTYPSNSLVKSNSVYWYSLVDTDHAPGTSDWEKFWEPMKIAFNTNGTPLNYNQNPKISTNYDEANNTMTLSFSIPRGYTGDTIIPWASNTVALDNGNAYVSNKVVGTTNFLSFGLPKGDKGDIGSTYMGLWTAKSYASNSLVRDGTNLWFASTDVTASDEPGTSQAWLLYLSDGPKGEIGNNGTNATITVGGVTNVPPTETNTLSEATFNVVPGENNSYAFYFGIPAGVKGDKGDKGALLSPKGNYETNVTYVQYDLVRYDNAQYYVSSENPVTDVSPTNTDYWTMFLQDGQSIAANATLIVATNGQMTGELYLDENTLMVTESDNKNYLTVVGGPGGGSTMNTRMISVASDSVTSDDYLIWMDGDTISTNQVLTLVNLTNDFKSIIVRNLSNIYNTEIQYPGTNTTTTLSGSGDWIAIDYINGKGWYAR